MEEEKKQTQCFAVVRTRGLINIFYENRETLKLLRLTRNSHATIMKVQPSSLGMLRKVQNYVTWGEISKESISILLKKRGRLIGNKKLTDEYAQQIGYKSLDEIAEAIHSSKLEFHRLPKIKPVFRLHPPKKGFNGKTKKSYNAGGTNGYRGEAINELIRRMV